MDRLQAMRCFVRVVKLGSFSAAADEMACSNATISKYVKYLEDWMQNLLLQRSTRSLQLTEAGQLFYQYCLRVEQDTQELHDQLSQERQQVAGRLVISAPVSLTLTLIGPLLLFGVWQLVIAAQWVKPVLLPPPGETLANQVTGHRNAVASRKNAIIYLPKLDSTGK